MTIEIITTPNESLKESGFGSLKSCQSIYRVIKYIGHKVILTVCKNEDDLYRVVLRKPDLVLLGVKYLSSDKNIWLADYFSNHNINFSGSIREILRFDSDKILAKTHLERYGLKTAKFFTALPEEFTSEHDLPLAFPLFLKPQDAANGNGIDDHSFVTNFEEYKSKVHSLHTTFGLPVLVEEYLDGREFTVAILQGADGKLIVSPIEIIPLESTKGLRILGQQAKKDDSEMLKRVTDSALRYKLIRLATDAFVRLGVRDFGRIDIKTNTQGECFFMEANLVPGMTEGSSYFPKACEIDHGISYTDVVRAMIEKGLSRIHPSIPVSEHSTIKQKVLAY